MIYTDLFNTAFDNLCETLAEITGLTVVNDPRNMRPNCLLVNPPSFDAFNYNIAKLSFNCTIILPPFRLHHPKTSLHQEIHQMENSLFQKVQ